MGYRYDKLKRNAQKIKCRDLKKISRTHKNKTNRESSALYTIRTLSLQRAYLPLTFCPESILILC